VWSYSSLEKACLEAAARIMLPLSMAANRFILSAHFALLIFLATIYRSKFRVLIMSLGQTNISDSVVIKCIYVCSYPAQKFVVSVAIKSGPSIK